MILNTDKNSAENIDKLYKRMFSLEKITRGIALELSAYRGLMRTIYKIQDSGGDPQDILNEIYKFRKEHKNG